MALWLVLEWYGATSEVPWLFLLAAWALALVGGSGAYALSNMSGLRLRLTVARARPSTIDELPGQLLRSGPVHPLFEGDGADVQIGLETRHRAQGPAWASGQIGGVTATVGVGVVPRSGWHRDMALDHLRRGPLGATAWAMHTSDPLGFFVGRRQCSDTEVGVVYPRFASLHNRRPVRELETAAAAPRAGSGNELFGIREYRQGDSLRRIHWRSSARLGELVVREYEPPGVHSVTIAVDPSPPSGDVADQIARIAASEAWDCLRDGGRVKLGTLETRDQWEVLEWLARYPGADAGDAAARADVVITANPLQLQARALRNWLVGNASAEAEVMFERVGTEWPLP
ncbi:MAG TPA: DUF58 domain-containing protein [Candidatus Dormibacteraeota bacterium]|nr:DUF58 domain-containing protein [Candidatus Dormibacteraeota bacterium]